MNSRQAAKAAAKRIEELEYLETTRVRDIKDYNQCILDVIAGKSVCSWCEEKRLGECQHEDSYMNAGCSEWWLRYPEGGDPDGKEEVPGATSDSSVQCVEEQ